MSDHSGPEDGELMRLTMDRLRAAGVAVSQPEVDGSAVIEVDGAEWVFYVGDNAEAELIYRPAEPGTGDPRWLADLATVLLTGRPAPDDHDPLLARLGDHRIKGAVGIDLRYRGFDVELRVHTDDMFFDASVEVVATNPDSPHAAEVCVGDSGFLTWLRDFWDLHAVDDPANPGYAWLPDLRPVADEFAEVIGRLVDVR